MGLLFFDLDELYFPKFQDLFDDLDVEAGRFGLTEDVFDVASQHLSLILQPLNTLDDGS